MLRYLRIAFSVTCGIACVLLIVLWVRSYGWMAGIGYNNGTCVFDVVSASGSVIFEKALSPGGNGPVIASMHLGVPAVLPHNAFDFQDHRPSFAAIFLPHWFLVLLCSTLAAAPWLRWRFSLLTLLIATTLVAVVLGLIIALIR